MERSRLEAAVDDAIESCSQYLQTLKQPPLVNSERAIIKTFVRYLTVHSPPIPGLSVHPQEVERARLTSARDGSMLDNPT